tara:strand:- start:3604 stop:3927 length:324 start_codon:yes stop_codon:yes gene_type:complete
MEANIPEIEKICGVKPDDVEFYVVGNDPNFVFTPDPSYGQKVLYYINEIDETIINVTSWFECANYVNGGWVDSLIPKINWEKNLFFSYLLFLLLYLSKDTFRKLLIK